MKLLKKILLIAIPIVLVFNIIAYVNTFVNEKYETQLEGIREDVTEVEMKKKKEKIQSQRKTIVITSVILSVVFVGLLIKKEILSIRFFSVKIPDGASLLPCNLYGSFTLSCPL